MKTNSYCILSQLSTFELIKSILIIFGLIVGLSQIAWAQDFEKSTFNDRRVINSQSVEMLPKRKLDIRISHRFGDLLGTAGGWTTLYGLENAADITTGGEYGISDNINVGLFRAKGAGELRQNLHFFTKARLMQQTASSKNPLSIVVLGMGSYSTMQKSENTGVLSNFSKPAYRFSYHFQVMFGRRFGDRLSLQANLNYTYRNLVYNFDQNDLPSVGVAGRIQLSKLMGFIFDANFPVLDQRQGLREYYYPIGVGFEFNTGGHIFQVNLTNAQGIAETDYIPYTYSNWLEGEFRLGFTISRIFNL